jgi:hypothetical protein
MNIFMGILIFTPWSFLALLAIRALRRTPVYGKIWVVTERYLEEFDWKKEPVNASAVDLIFVKQTEVNKDFLKGELNEQVDAGTSQGFESPRSGL